MEAWIALENGLTLPGKLFGAPLPAGGEVVFHTGMTGYQEILTDPSYAGQIVVFTASHIGNYGIHPSDYESTTIHPSAVIVRDFCRMNFHRRSEMNLDQVLRRSAVPAIADVDTRALTIALRDHGVCRGWVGTGDPAELVEKSRSLPPIADTDWVARVSTRKVYSFSRQPDKAEPFEVAVLDCGVKKSILQRLVDEGCRVRVFPSASSASQLMAGPTEGVFLSNGPGDPASQPALVQTIRDLLEAQIPVFGICLGHQLLARALGADTEKLSFGHHGANHPVLRLSDGKVETTSQNHNYAVPSESLNPQQAVITHRSLNDGSVEGLLACNHPAYSVQYHPEAAPGPSDSLYLFRQFRDHMAAVRSNTSREMKKHAASG